MGRKNEMEKTWRRGRREERENGRLVTSLLLPPIIYLFIYLPITATPRIEDYQPVRSANNNKITITKGTAKDKRKLR